jgi:hypothetical protein
MSADGDQLNLSAHWHVDCRMVADLPEDSIIGIRFLINLSMGALTLTFTLGVAWLLYGTLALRESLGDWEKRFAERRVEIAEVENLQLAFNREAVAVDLAHELIYSRLPVTNFVQQLGRTRPDLMVIDLIERSGNLIILRGTLRESSERASRLLTAHVQQLREDPAVGPPFQDIVISSLERVSEGDLIRFELTFRLKPEN